MKKTEKIVLCYFFKKMDYHPKEKLKELSDEVKNYFDDSFVFNNKEINNMYSMPRIEAISKDKKMFFQMSLINANITFNINSQDDDDVLLWINNHLQFFFDVFKNVFGVKIIYSSFKIVSVYDDDDSTSKLSKKLKIADNLENWSFNRGYAKDNTYYLNILYMTNKEYNFNLINNERITQQDLLDLTMITSLQDAEFKRNFLLETIEINDRLAFNNDKNYLSTKENIRGMIIELKRIINENELNGE